MPNNVSKTLPKIFKQANKNSVFFIRLKVSNENVEKVVKPPQNPTPRKSFSVKLKLPFSSNPKIKTPIIILPIIFTASVP